MDMVLLGVLFELTNDSNGRGWKTLTGRHIRVIMWKKVTQRLPYC